MKVVKVNFLGSILTPTQTRDIGGLENLNFVPQEDGTLLLPAAHDFEEGKALLQKLAGMIDLSTNMPPEFKMVNVDI